MFPILTKSSVMTCAHQGQVQVNASQSKVTVDGHPVLTQTVIPSISGCSLPPPAGGPCGTATFAVAATRVRASGVPVVLKNAVAPCTPTGTPLTVMLTQTRVMAV